MPPWLQHTLQHGSRVRQRTPHHVSIAAAYPDCALQHASTRYSVPCKMPVLFRPANVSAQLQCTLPHACQCSTAVYHACTAAVYIHCLMPVSAPLQCTLPVLPQCTGLSVLHCSVPCLPQCTLVQHANTPAVHNASCQYCCSMIALHCCEPGYQFVV
jgi:hypothetical protein